MMGWLKKKAHEQWADNSNVVPEHRWSEKDHAFFLNSPAGLIRYKAKDFRDINRFRDKWVNQFSSLVEAHKSVPVDRMFCLLYKDIMASERVRYTANVRTRLRVKCAF